MLEPCNETPSQIIRFKTHTSLGFENYNNVSLKGIKMLYEGFLKKIVSTSIKGFDCNLIVSWHLVSPPLLIGLLTYQQIGFFVPSWNLTHHSKAL